MVTRDEMRRIAARYETQVARAFRRVLGMAERREGRKRRRTRRGRRPHPEWRGMRECFRNERSPLDSGKC